MNHCFVYPLAAGLGLFVAPCALVADRPSPQGVADVEILINGAPQPRYAYEGRWYLEARNGQEYAIRLHNPYPVRAAVALSVDGLNTIDARETTAAHAQKWVLDPHQTITISGWQTSQTEARRFEFTTEERSYGQALGKTANLGVISAVFYRERVQPVVPPRLDDFRSSAVPASPPVPAVQEASAAGKSQADEYAATGMGRRTGHAVTQVRLDLESRPVQTVNFRYEFRPQLVRLGILPAVPLVDPLQRRERAQGFAQGFCPEPPRPR